MDKLTTRLRTFTELDSFVSATELAENGFYFVRAPDTVRCFSCKIELANWTEETGSPMSRHFAESKCCSFINETIRKNGLLYPTSDVCGAASDKAESRMRYKPTEVNITKCYRSDKEANGHTTSRTDNIYVTIVKEIEVSIAAKFPEYASFPQRMKSFQSESCPWPSYYTPLPEFLAAAGFYFLQNGKDKVQCAFCSGKLYNWGEHKKIQDPLVEHMKRFSRCAFIIKLKARKLTTFLTNISYNDWYENSFVQLPVAQTLLGKGHVTTDIRMGIQYLHKSAGVKLCDLNEQLLTEAVTQLTETQGDQKQRSKPEIRRLRRKVEQLELENNFMLSRKHCLTCKTTTATVLFLPCRHIVCCEKCNTEAKDSENRVCLQCKTPIDDFIKTYRA